MLYKTAFMSHAHADNAKCDPYADVLQKRGISLYYDRANPQVGRDLGITLEREIQQANALIVMVTPSALKSFWVTEEISMFFSLMAQDPSRLLIPVKLEPCQLPPRLAARWWIDATTLPMPQVVDQLAKALEVAGPPFVSSPAPSPSVRPPDVGATPATTSTPSSAPVRPTEQPKPAPSSPQQTIPTPRPPLVSQPAPGGNPNMGISRRALIVTGAVGVAAIGTGIIWWSRTNYISGVSNIPRATSTPATLFTYRGHTGDVLSVSWSPDGTRVASADANGTVRVWDAADGGHPYGVDASSVTSVAWSPKGNRIASAGATMQIWDAADGGNLATFQGFGGFAAWSPSGVHIASGKGDSNGPFIQVWNAADGRDVVAYHGDFARLTCSAWSPSGMFIASGDGFLRTVQVWNAASGGHAFTYSGHSAAVHYVAWSPNGIRIASCSGDGTVQVWDAVNGDNPYTHSGHSGQVYCVSWNPNGTRVVSCCDDGTVQVWDAIDGGHPYIYRGHSDIVWSVAWSPNGTHIASASRDGTVQIWQPQ